MKLTKHHEQLVQAYIASVCIIYCDLMTIKIRSGEWWSLTEGRDRTDKLHIATDTLSNCISKIALCVPTVIL